MIERLRAEPRGGNRARRLRRGGLSAAFIFSHLGCSLVLDVPSPASDRAIQVTAGAGGAETGGAGTDVVENLGGMGGAMTPHPGGATMSHSGGALVSLGGANDGTGGANDGTGGSIDGTGGAEEEPEPHDDCVTACDCDGDGALSIGECGGDDCDDEDSEVHPGQVKFFAQRSENPIVGFDYDCSGILERPPNQSVQVTCGALDLLDCAGAQGYFGVPPPCGQSGSFGTCVLNGIFCVESVTDSAAIAICH